MKQKSIQRISTCIALLFLGGAVWLVSSEFKKIGVQSVFHLISKTPLHVLSAALCFTFLDYIMLSGYDFSALSYIGKKVPFLKVITNAMISFSVTNTTGHSYAAGGSLRYLLYRKAGLEELDVFKMIAFESLTFLLGMIGIFNGALLLCFLLKTPVRNFSSFCLIAFIVDFLFLCYCFIMPNRQFHTKHFQIKIPSLKQTGLQMLIGSLDIACVSLVFYTILNFHVKTSAAYCFVIFILAQLIGLCTQVPGGLGVFEASFLSLFSHTPEQKGGILAALLTFRIIYYFVPLFISSLYLMLRSLAKKL